MAVLPNKELTEHELNYYRENYFDFGAESTIYRNDSNKIYKIWNQEEKESLEQFKGRTENKYQKIKRCHAENIRHIPRIYSTLSYQGTCIGYEQSFDEDDYILLIAPLDKEDRLEKEKQMLPILNYFTDLGIVYGDIKNDNILINRKTGAITFCDIDNIRYQEFPMDIVSSVLDRFINLCGSEDKKIHSYMHNLLTLEQLHPNICSYEEVLGAIQLGEYDDFLEEKGKKLVKELHQVTPNYSGDYIVNYIKN